MVVVAIDQGTSGTKALVRDADGEILAVEETPVRPSYLGDGAVEIDPQILLDSVLEAGRCALRAAGNPTVSAVALSNQGETVMAWDRDSGRPLSAAIIWQDRRAESICTELEAQRETVAAKTGLVLDPYFSAPKMTWLRRNVSDRGVVTTTDTWFIHQLTGEFVTDVDTATRSLLVDIDTLAWDGDLLSTFDLDHEPLPRIVANDQIVGSTSAFGSEAAVGGLMLDQQAAMVAQGCLVPGSLKCTYGTGAFMFANAGQRAVRSSSGLTTSAAWKLRDRSDYCLDGQVYAAGSALRWLVDLGLLSSPKALDDECADANGGVTFVPALAGLAAPWWSPRPAASFTGMGLSSGPGYLVRAVVESIAAQVAVVARNAADEMGQPLERLRVDGGLTASSVLMQAQADLTQTPVDVYPSPHATALGTAMMGQLALSEGSRLEDVVEAWIPAATYEPQWSPERAEEFLAHWENAVQTTLGDRTP